MIRNVRDTFLHYLADNLAYYPVPIAFMRADPNDPAASLIKQNTVQVEFTDFNADTVASLVAYIYVTQEDDNVAADWVWALWDLLSATFMTRIYDYSDPANPVELNLNIMWDRGAVKFRKIADDHYSRYGCQLHLRFTAIND